MLSTKLTARLLSFNWPALLLGGLLFVLWTYHWYSAGAESCERNYASLVVDSLQDRLPVVHQAERGAALMEQELRTIKERLDEEAKKPYATDCSVTPEQLQLYRALSEKTQL